jgi:nucleoside-diphosphate-sugar epimerase
MKGHVLVTGAGGFIGRHLVDALLADGWAVRAATREPGALRPRNGMTTVALADLPDVRDWSAWVDGTTHVLHLAGLAHATERIPEERYMAVNARPVTALAEAARRGGVKRFVLMSSVRAQSGPTAASVLTEAMPPRPTDAYGRSKLEAERLLSGALAGATTDWVVLRPVLVYGRGVAGNMRTLLSLARSPLPLPFAGLNGRRSLLGVVNLASAVLQLLSIPTAVRAVFLAADPGPVSVAEMVRAMREGLGRPPRLVGFPEARMAMAARVLGQSAAWERLARDLVVDTSALEGMGWRPQESTQDGLRRWAHAERVPTQSTQS